MPDQVWVVTLGNVVLPRPSRSSSRQLSPYSTYVLTGGARPRLEGVDGAGIITPGLAGHVCPKERLRLIR